MQQNLTETTNPSEPGVSLVEDGPPVQTANIELAASIDISLPSPNESCENVVEEDSQTSAGVCQAQITPAPSSSLPLQPKSSSPQGQMREISEGLSINPPTSLPLAVTVSATEEKGLKAEILQTWQQHEQKEKELGPRLYKLCALLHAPGRKGQGFDAWLKSNGKSRATAYRWINKFAKREGLALPYQEKKVPAAGKQSSLTSSHMRQPSSPEKRSSAHHEGYAEYVPAPASLTEITDLLRGYFGALSAHDQYKECKALIAWMVDNVLKDTVAALSVLAPEAKGEEIKPLDGA